MSHFTKKGRLDSAGIIDFCSQF